MPDPGCACAKCRFSAEEERRGPGRPRAGSRLRGRRPWRPRPPRRPRPAIVGILQAPPLPEPALEPDDVGPFPDEGEPEPVGGSGELEFETGAAGGTCEVAALS